MSDADMQWDEDRTGTRDPNNLISFPREDDYTVATAKVLPWRDGIGESEKDRRTIPSSFVERLFRRAPVPNPEELFPVKFQTKALGVEEYLREALKLLTRGSRASEISCLAGSDK